MTSRPPSAVTYRQQQEAAGSRTVRWSVALGNLVIPIFRPVVRRIPWLRRRIDKLLPARLGAASSLVEKGRFAEAFALALAGVEDTGRQRARKEGDGRSWLWFEELHGVLWWAFLHSAATAAAKLGRPEREQVETLLASPPEPGGIREAECLDLVARWRWQAGDGDGALDLARRSVLADPTWPSGHVLLAWLGLVTGKLDPLPVLREAVRLSPATLATIRADSQFSKHPHVIAWLESVEMRQPM